MAGMSIARAAILSLTTLLCSAVPQLLASHPKPPHGHWIGDVVGVEKSSVTVSVTDSWEYGSIDSADSIGKTITFRPMKRGFTIAGNPVRNQDLAAHFKVGETVTLNWVEMDDLKNHIFFDISKGDDRAFVADKSMLVPVADPQREVRREDFAGLLAGRWAIRTYGYEFKPDGTMRMFNPEDGETMENGSWSVRDDELSMAWDSRGPQVVRIKFLGPDLWEWHSTDDRVWEAARIGTTR